MKFDAVHDLQNIYRKILKCMSCPGHIENIAAVASKLDVQIAAGKPLTTLLLTLLDGEVKVCFASAEAKATADKISHLTYCSQSAVTQADYIVITANTAAAELSEAIANARIGTLSDPHESATVIIEVAELSKEKGLLLKGPGIKDWTTLKVVTRHNWLALRKQKVAEFPLGIDMVLLDAQGNIACLPRTTKITAQEAI